MAGYVQKLLDKPLPNVKNEKLSNMECAVCLQTCVHPAELPCGHIFCYLCIKGIVNQGRRCAMCRRDIPVDYLDKPRLLNPLEAEISSQGFEDGHLWFYEGHNGWWQYDERTSLELESAYQKEERCCELLIAGFLYVADFDEMLQYRKTDPSKRRRIKRDLATTNKKGVAGLKSARFINPASINSTTGASNEVHSSASTDGSVAPDVNSVRTCTPATSNIFTETIINQQQSRERILSGLSHSICSSTPPRNSSLHTDNSAACSSSFNFDNVIHETLDWTIEQIESLNLELLNDYEVLIRDVNNCGIPNGTSNQCRSERVVDNYFTRYLKNRYCLREPRQNELEGTYQASNSSQLNNENNDSETSASQEILNANETESNESQGQSGIVTSPRRMSKKINFLNLHKF